MEMNVIRRVEIRGSAPGVAETTKQLQGLSQAQDQVAASGEKLGTITDINTKRQISAAQAIDRLRASMDSTYRAQQQLERGQALVDRAFQQGAIDAQRQAEMLGLLQQRYRTAIAATHGLTSANTLSTHQLANMQFQLQDIAVGLASGQSPFTVMMQQGSQMAQMFQSGTGVMGALRAVGSGIVSFVTNPLNLAVIGFGLLATAGVAAFNYIFPEIKKTNKELDVHADLIGRLKDAWGDAAKGVEAYGKESETVLRFLEQREQILRRQAVETTIGQFTFVSGIGTRGRQQTPPMFRTPAGEIPQSSPFFRTIQAMNERVAAGVPDAVTTFQRSVVDIAQANRSNLAIQQQAAALLEATDAGAKAERAIRGYEEALKTVERNRLKEEVDAGTEALKKQTEAWNELMKTMTTGWQTAFGVIAGIAGALGTSIGGIADILTQGGPSVAPGKRRAEERKDEAQRAAENNRKAIEAYNDALRDSIKATEDLRKATSSAFTSIVNDIRSGASAGQILLNVLNRIFDAATKKLGDMIANALFPGGSGGLGGMFPGTKAPSAPNLAATAGGLAAAPLTGAAAAAVTGGGNVPNPMAGQYDPLTGRVVGGGGGAAVTANGLPSVAAMTAEINRVFPQYGVDPAVALRIARAEGLGPGIWQSNVGRAAGNRETSYGPFQLRVGGGLGDVFQAQTGLNPADPANWQAMIPFVAQYVQQHGWGAWMGRGPAGVGIWEGISRQISSLLGGGIGAMVTHAGGLIGDGDHMRPTRRMPLAMFANAPRMHSGGWLAADERPAILQTGERVLSRADVAQGRRRGGGFATTINVDARGSQIGETQIRGIVAGQLKEHRADLTRHFGDVQRTHNLLKG